MKSIHYIIAVILVIGWLIGFVGYNIMDIVYILLVITEIVVLLNIIQGRKALD